MSGISLRALLRGEVVGDTADPWEKAGIFLWSGPRQPLAMSCAPVAVPLDKEVPVARGFRRLHARGV